MDFAPRDIIALWEATLRRKSLVQQVDTESQRVFRQLTAPWSAWMVSAKPLSVMPATIVHQGAAAENNTRAVLWTASVRQDLPTIEM